MPVPITRYGSIAGIESVGVRPEALARFSADQKKAALEGVSRLIDSHFRQRFTLPLLQVGEDVNRCANILAAYDLLSGRGMNPEGNDQNIVDRADREREWLRDVAKGTVIPDVTDSAPAALEGQASVVVPRVISAPSRGFSANCGPGGWPTGRW